MSSASVEDVKSYVKQNIGSFHQARLASLKSLRLKDILKRKNPYLFKAKNITLAQDLVKAILDAHLSSQEETIFGDFLENLAVFINKKAYDGKKSSAKGIDLEFDNEGTRYIVSIKSGPNWGNSRQVAKMRDDFKKAQQILRTGKSKLHVTAVNGCCYGRDNKPDKGDYFKYCGQAFWKFISGSPDLYLQIIRPLGHTAKIWNVEFSKEYSQIVNKFTSEFSQEYVVDGEINWDALVQFNSSESMPNNKAQKRR